MTKISIQLAAQIRRTRWFRFVVARMTTRVGQQTSTSRITRGYSDPQCPFM